MSPRPRVSASGPVAWRPQPAMSVEAGLCGTCAMCRRIVTARGSTFFYCTRADSDPAYAKYPRLPVLHCAGYLNSSPPTPDSKSFPLPGGRGCG